MAKWIWKKYENKSILIYAGEEINIENDFNISARASQYNRYIVDENTGEITLSVISSGECGWMKIYVSEMEIYRYVYGCKHLISHRTYFKATKEIKIVKKSKFVKGSYIGEVIADENAYTNDARNSDGYWYVRDRQVGNIFYNQNKAVNKFYNQNKLLKVRQQGKEW